MEASLPDRFLQAGSLRYVTAWKAVLLTRAHRGREIFPSELATIIIHAMSPMPNNSLETPITGLRGVGAERSAQLARLGINTVEDL